MAFFRNDAINRVNLHYGIVALAQGAGQIFFLVFLLKAGIPIPQALLVQAALVFGRFAVRPVVLPIAKRCGLKPTLIGGTILLAAQYPVLAEVHGLDTALVAVCGLASLGEVFYWMAFNANYAALGDLEHRGHQISAREVLVAAAGIVAPVLGAWAIVSAGPRIAFAGVACVQLLAVVPLLGLPNVAVKPKVRGMFRAARVGVLLAAIDGWFDTFFLLLWRMALFVSLKESFVGYGGAMALAGLAGAAFGVVLGRHVDAGHGRRSVLVSYGVLTAAALLHAGSLGSPELAVFANTFGAPAMALISPVLGAASYNLAKNSPCPLRFSMGTEAGWDAGCFFACLLAAALVFGGVSLPIILLGTLPALAASVAVLWRLYPSKAAEAVANYVRGEIS